MLTVGLVADPTHLQFKGLVLRFVVYSIDARYQKTVHQKMKKMATGIESKSGKGQPKIPHKQ